MSLDKKLKDLDIEFLHGVPVRLPDSAIEAIKQAFIDEGWQEPNEFGQVAYTTQLVDGVVNIVPEQANLMTGPEWLARFEKNLTAMPCDQKYVLDGGETIVETHSMSHVELAARRAAGVED
jgi:hypothetical protein